MELEKIKRALDIFSSRIDVSEYEKMPKTQSLVAILQYRHKNTHLFYLVIIFFICIGWLSLFFINIDLRKELKKPQEYIILPSHIPNILRVRANTISDEIIYEFSEFMADCLGSFDYEGVQRSFDYCSKFMSQEFRTKFKRLNKSKIKFWKKRKVYQGFSFTTPQKYKRINTGNGIVFRVEVRGQVNKSINGVELPAYGEKMILTFRPGRIGLNKSWIFELVDMKRMTYQEERAIEEEEKYKKELK